MELKEVGEIYFWAKSCFLIRGPELGEIIPFPVWIIPFPILKINSEFLGLNEKHFVKDIF